MNTVITFFVNFCSEIIFGGPLIWSYTQWTKWWMATAEPEEESLQCFDNVFYNFIGNSECTYQILESIVVPLTEWFSPLIFLSRRMQFILRIQSSECRCKLSTVAIVFELLAFYFMTDHPFADTFLLGIRSAYVGYFLLVRKYNDWLCGGSLVTILITQFLYALRLVPPQMIWFGENFRMLFLLLARCFQSILYLHYQCPIEIDHHMETLLGIRTESESGEQSDDEDDEDDEDDTDTGLSAFPWYNRCPHSYLIAHAEYSQPLLWSLLAMQTSEGITYMWVKPQDSWPKLVVITAACYVALIATHNYIIATTHFADPAPPFGEEINDEDNYWIYSKYHRAEETEGIDQTIRQNSMGTDIRNRGSQSDIGGFGGAQFPR